MDLAWGADKICHGYCWDEPHHKPYFAGVAAFEDVLTSVNALTKTGNAIGEKVKMSCSQIQRIQLLKWRTAADCKICLQVAEVSKLVLQAFKVIIIPMFKYDQQCWLWQIWSQISFLRCRHSNQSSKQSQIVRYEDCSSLDISLYSKWPSLHVRSNVPHDCPRSSACSHFLTKFLISYVLAITNLDVERFCLQQPSNEELKGLLQPVAIVFHQIDSLANEPRATSRNHAKAASEALQSLNWVCYSGPNSGKRVSPLFQFLWSTNGLKCLFLSRSYAIRYPHSTQHLYGPYPSIAPNSSWNWILRCLIANFESISNVSYRSRDDGPMSC